MTRHLALPSKGTLFLLVLVLAWDVSGLDLPVAALSADAGGFYLRANWFLINVLHEAARFISWAAVAVLLVAVFRPFGPLRQISRLRRVQFLASVVLSVSAVTLIKHFSRTSCPWDLREFGGMAQYVSHWAWGTSDGGPGRCFPGGHASAAFAWLGGYFALRHGAESAARRWLLLVAPLGLVLGVAQQLRGAHYTSHTLWTALICWTVGWAVDALFTAFAARRSHPTVAATPEAVSVRP